MRLMTRGFTLLEVLISVVIMVTLLSIAIPSYQESIRRSRRAEAQSALFGLAQALERYFTNCNTYANVTTAACNGSTATSVNSDGSPASGLFPTNIPSSGGTTNYTLSIVIGGTPAGSNYTITATRASSGPQASDPCGDFTLTAAGARAVVNGSRTLAQCWS